MKNLSRWLLLVASVFFTATALYNVMSDNFEVKRMASAAACGPEGPECPARMTSMERTPFAQTFEYVAPKRTVTVRCTRALVLVGDYACAVR